MTEKFDNDDESIHTSLGSSREIPVTDAEDEEMTRAHAARAGAFDPPTVRTTNGEYPPHGRETAGEYRVFGSVDEVAADLIGKADAALAQTPVGEPVSYEPAQAVEVEGNFPPDAGLPVSEIELLAAGADLDESEATAITKRFNHHYHEYLELAGKAKNIVVTDESQTDLMKQARTVRLSLKNIRVDVEKTRKVLKEDSLRRGQLIDQVARTIKDNIEPIEKRLQDAEDFAAIAEKKRLDALENERIDLLSPWVEDVAMYGVRYLAEEMFQVLLADSKQFARLKAEAAQRAEAERLEQERADAEEKERLRVENERLQSEKLEADRQRREAEERERQANREREQAESELRRKQDEDAAEKLRVEREVEAGRRQIEAARQAALAAPDAEKLLNLSNVMHAAFASCQIEMQTDAGKSALARVSFQLGQLVGEIRNEAKALEVAKS